MDWLNWNGVKVVCGNPGFGRVETNLEGVAKSLERVAVGVDRGFGLAGV
jgi:hypothetical protein